VKPTPDTIRRFSSHAEVDADGALVRLTHKCRPCQIMEN
jgi:hypothetical protein